MKPTTRFASWVCLILFMANTVGAELTILTEDLPPYNYTENGKLTGATTQVVQEIMRRLGIDDSIAVVPWARGYQRLNNEPNVVLFTTALTPERERRFHWVGPLFDSRMVFFARQSDPRRIESLEAAKQVAAVATYREDSG
jgi:polar amino acid transport system substrate-binding protein